MCRGEGVGWGGMCALGSGVGRGGRGRGENGSRAVHAALGGWAMCGGGEE